MGDIADARVGRDAEFLNLLSSYTQSAVPMALLLHFVPLVFQPLAGRIVRAMRNRLYHQKLLRKLVPIVRERIDSAQRTGEASPTFLAWCLEDQMKNKDPTVAAIDPITVAENMMQLNFAGTHTTAIMTTNALYHILSFPQAESLIFHLRQETTSVLDKTRDSNLTWSDLEQMPLLDSVLRETLRVSPFLATAIERTIHREVATPSGLTLAAGSKVCVSGVSANQSAHAYVDPTIFDPYRFVQQQESAAMPSKEFVTFGYGVHVSLIRISFRKLRQTMLIV